MEKNIDDKSALRELKKGYGKAKTLLDDVDELERFLQRLIIMAKLTKNSDLA